MIEINNCYNCDCKQGMEEMLLQGLIADWCITDPPYGIRIGEMSYSNSGGKRIGKAVRRDYNTQGKWDNCQIDGVYFDLMRECSKDQIIFGGNYYTDILPPTKSWVVWDKRSYSQTDRNDFADCELAWASKGVARVFHYMYNGMLQDDKNKDYRFHVTQKPTQLWVKLLNFYTKPNDLILDAFAGSQSLRIACWKTGRRYIGFEIDKDYYDKGTAWFKNVSSQVSFFD